MAGAGKRHRLSGKPDRYACELGYDAVCGDATTRPPRPGLLELLAADASTYRIVYNVPSRTGVNIEAGFAVLAGKDRAAIRRRLGYIKDNRNNIAGRRSADHSGNDDQITAALAQRRGSYRVLEMSCQARPPNLQIFAGILAK